MPFVLMILFVIAFAAWVDSKGREEDLKRPAKNGDEQDAFYAPHWYRWRPGQRKRAKQRANRRDRRAWRRRKGEDR